MNTPQRLEQLHCQVEVFLLRFYQEARRHSNGRMQEDWKAFQNKNDVLFITF